MPNNTIRSFSGLQQEYKSKRNAIEVCASNGWRLISIDTEEVNQFLSKSELMFRGNVLQFDFFLRIFLLAIYR